MKYSSRLPYVISIIVISLVIFSDTRAEDTRPNTDYGSNSFWAMNLQGGYVHMFDTDLDRGGSFRVNRYYVQGGPAYRPRYDRSISLSVGYGYDKYDFSGTFDNYLSPWDEVHTLRVSAPVRWGNGDLSFIAVPTFRVSAESTSDWSDGFTGGAFAGISYRVNESLIIGPGIGVISQLEDSASIFPVLIVSWKITDKLTLETGKGVAATQGPGLTLKLSMTDHLDVFLGGRYEKKRFRLADKGPVPEGIGEDTSLPVYCGMNYSFTKKVKASVIGGIMFGGQLSIEDRDGNPIEEDDYDPVPYMGLFFSGRF